MASKPQQASGQTAKQDPEQAETSSLAEKRPRTASISQASEDSQTVLLNHPSPTETLPDTSPKHSMRNKAWEEGLPSPATQAPEAMGEPKKCWICLQDETDDTPTSSRWRSPCACRLQAHESCLLDWVAEVEKPGPTGVTKSKVQCPQCKTPIRVIRPRSYFLELLKRLQRVQGQLILPFCAGLLAGGVLVGCYMHGVGSAYVIFGEEDFDRMAELYLSTRPWYRNPLHFVFPSIPLALLASRTSWADRPLSMLPLIYLGLHTPSFSAPLWPPSAPMTLVALPYVRAIYNGLYGYLFASKEKSWIKELQPRGGDDDNRNEQNGQDEPAANEGNMNIEFGIQVEVVEEEEEEDQDEGDGPAQQEAVPQPQQQGPLQPAPAQDQEVPPPAQQGQQGGQQDEPIAAQLAPPADHQNQQQNQNGNGNGVANAANAIPILVNVVLEKAIGAIIFPGVAAGMGFALKFALPLSWTTAEKHVPPSFLQNLLGQPASTPINGFLQSRFGRSIAGGLLFVVLRDSLSLFSKYKMAQQQRQRSIADYESRIEKDKD